MIEAIHQKIDTLPQDNLLGNGNSRITRPYTLFGEVVPDYFTVTNNDGQGYLAYTHSSRPDACLWPLPSGARPPGYGMMVANNLTNTRPESAIDLGCGGTLFLGRLVHYLGAEDVVGVDIVPPVEGSDQLEADGLTYLQANMLSSTFPDNLPRRRKFDLVISNPPMMPAPEAVSQTDHDFAGETGREVLDATIELAPTLLRPGGHLVFGQFDFLGIDHSYGDPPSTADVLADHNMIPEEVHIYRIPASKVTEEARGRILQRYPKYAFEEEAGRLYHRFAVVKAKLSTST